MADETITTEAEPTYEQFVSARTATPAENPVSSEPTGETAAESDTAESKTQDTPAKRDRTAQGRISELHGEAKREKERADRLEEELRQYRTRKPEPETKAEPEAKTAEEDAEPSEERFTTYTEYVRALARWEGRQVSKTERAREADERKAQQQADTQKTNQQQYEEKYVKAKEEFPDLEEKLATATEAMRQAGGFAANPRAQQALEECDAPGKVLYKLAGDPSEMLRIMRLPGDLAYREIIRLDARLSVEVPEKPKQQPISKNPAPISTVGGAANTVKDLTEVTDFEEYMRLRKKKSG